MINGICQVCGCTDATPCTILSWEDPSETAPCSWMDAAHTLCSNPRCVAGVPLDILLDIVFPRLPHQLEARR